MIPCLCALSLNNTVTSFILIKTLNAIIMHSGPVLKKQLMALLQLLIIHTKWDVILDTKGFVAVET